MMTQGQSSITRLKGQYRLRVTPELELWVLKSLRDLLLLALEFFIENTVVQLISTVDHNHYPLRDLGYELLIQIESRKIAYITPRLSVEEIALIWVLFGFLNGSKGITILQKGARCLTIARTLRMCLFSLTILPSPKPWCRFVGPIEPFKAHVGGACNDLLYSGHVIIYTLSSIAFTVLSREYSVQKVRCTLRLVVWFHMCQCCVATILERHHYSIDMFLGFFVTLLIWQCQPLHFDLPRVPANLFSHLKQLFCPKLRSTLKEV